MDKLENLKNSKATKAHKHNDTYFPKSEVIEKSNKLYPYKVGDILLILILL